MTSVRVLHDGSFHRPGGGARVARELAKALDAPVTVGHCAQPQFWEGEGLDVDIPFQRQVDGVVGGRLPRPARELRLGQLFRSVDITEDIVVTSGTAAKWIVPKSFQHHVHYCHVPPPRFYGEGQGGSTNPLAWGLRQVGSMVDQHYAGFVDQFVANSTWTRERVGAHYRRDAEVLHPPVRTSRFSWLPPAQPPYVVLIAGRLVEMKRADAVAEAFADIRGANLVIVGDGPLRSECESVDGVSVYPDLSDFGVELVVGRATAGIAFAAGEHCGITPKEMQAAGKPVIVPDEPNLCNHVRDGETGVVVSPDVGGVREGVARILEEEWDRGHIESSADGWSTDAFHDRARELILPEETDDAPTADHDDMQPITND